MCMCKIADNFAALKKERALSSINIESQTS